MRSAGLVLVLVLASAARAQTALELIVEGEKLATEQTKVSLDKARALFEQGLALAAGDQALQARALYRLGLNAIFRRDARQAVAYFDRAIPLQRALGQRAEETRSHNNKAAAFWQLGDVVEALATYETVLPIRRELKDRLGESLTEGGIGNCHVSLGEPGPAIEHYRKALAIAREIGDKNQQAEMHNSLGNALVHAGDFGGAVAEFQIAQGLWTATGNKLRLLYVRNNLGWVHVGLRNYRAATGYLDGLERDTEPTGDRQLTAYAMHNLGSAYAGAGLPAQARAEFEKSLRIKREIGDRLGEAYTLQALGEILPAEAETHWRQALTLRREISDRQGLTITLGALARLHREQGKLTEARQEIEEAIELIESRRAALASQDLRATYFSRNRDYYDFLIDLLMAQGDLKSALEVAERARGRQLLDRVSDSLAQVRVGVDAKLLARERHLQRRINLAAGKAPRAQMETLLREAREVAAEIRRASPRYASLVSPEPIGTAAMQALLMPGDTLLVYHVGERQGFVWSVTPAGVRHRVLPGRGALERQLRAVRDKVIARQEAQTAITALQATLIPAGLGGKRVIVAPDGLLESAPFALLVRAEIAYLPSATALALRRRERPPVARRVDILADPVFSPADARLAAPAPPPATVLPRLRFSRTEADALAALTASPRVALDFAANRNWLDGLREAGIVHLATHALVNAQYPELSALVLSQVDANGRPVDGTVRLGEIFNLPLRARLVTLSACRSAGGTELPGEGLMSLTRGFLYAGAGAVLASLWDVDDRATAELMRRFYAAHLGKRRPLAAALRLAQDSLRAEPGWSDPYYWAGFVLQGEWR